MTMEPIHYAAAKGDTRDEMRANIAKSALARRGDCVLVWINEGDLHSLNRPEPVDMTAPAQLVTFAPVVKYMVAPGSEWTTTVGSNPSVLAVAAGGSAAR